MKNKYILGIVCILFVSLCLLFFKVNSPQRELHIYFWAEYIDPKLIVEFEKKYNCKVVFDYFENNEAMYAKLKIGKTSGYYDIISPSSYMASIMDREGLLERLDHSKLPNIKSMMNEYLSKTDDPEMIFSIPYAISYACLGYKINQIPISKEILTWSIFNNKNFYKKITMLNDMRETIGIALKYLGYSLNTIKEEELLHAKELLLDWRDNIISYQVDDSKTSLAYDLVYLIHYYSGDVIKMNINDKPKEYDFVIPKEGTSIGIDVLVITNQSNNKDLAYNFINFINDAKNCAQNMKYIKCLTPNKDAMQLLDEDFLKIITIQDEHLLNISEVIKDLGQDNQKYINIWNDIIIQ